MKVLDILKRAAKVVQKLPLRQLSEQTKAQYRAVHQAMRKCGCYDPMATANRNTYHRNRAALHFCAREAIVKLADGVEAAMRSRNDREVQGYARALHEYLDAVEPMLRAHPACEQIDFDTTSPWQEKDNADTAGARSKKYLLGGLAPEWRTIMFEQTPIDSPYRAAIAVMCLSPARVGEFEYTVRDNQFSPGVRVIRKQGRLIICTVPLKSHAGRFGTKFGGVVIAIAKGGTPAAHLAKLCDAEGGAIEVHVESTEALRKTISRIGHAAGLTGISATCFRTQWIADAKATYGSGEEVAAGAGHCSIRSQSRYGRVEHGRKGGGGLIGTFCERQPKAASQARLQRFEALRARHPKTTRAIAGRARS